MTSTSLWRPAVLVKTKVWVGYSQVHKTWSGSFLIKDFLSKVANLIVVQTVTGRLRWRLVLIAKLCWLSAQSYRDF